MKKRLSLFSIFMALVVLFSCFLVGCTKDGGTSGSGESTSWFTPKGVHDRKVKVTNDYLVSNNTTQYKIVVPSDAKDYDLLAAEVINEFMFEAVGVTFPIVRDDVYSNADQGKFISIGTTALIKKTGISINVEKFGQSGYRIKTIGDDIYISGSRVYIGEGTYYGALDFLAETINWHAYSIDEIKYDVKSDIEFKEFDIVEIPEFDNRRYGIYPLDTNHTWTRYMRLNIRNETQINVTAHSHFEILPPAEYYADHQDWYYWYADRNNDGKLSSNEGQLCLSNEDMVQEFIKRVVQLFRDNPGTNFIHIGQQDIQTECKCTNCAEYKKYIDKDGNQKEMNYAGILVKFTNRVARAVTAELQKTEPERKVYFEMFAYHVSEYPPTIKDPKTGEQTPMCDEVICDDNVYVQFTPNANFKGAGVSLLHEKNSNVYEMLQGWKKCCSLLSTWQYATNFNWVLFNFPNWDSYAEDLKILSDAGATRAYDQNMIWRSVPQMLKMRIYCESQLMWDLSKSYYELASDFIENYYGDAAPNIQQMFDLMNSYWAELKYDKGVIGGIYFTLDNKEFWDFEYVEAVRKVFVNAFESIKPLEKTNPAEYEKYYWRICDAYLENLYMQLQYYGAEYGADYCATAIDLFDKIIKKFGYEYMGEGTGKPLSTYIKTWRASYV